MKARRFPGVRCSTLNTECRSLLCLMIMPGRSWVAGIDIASDSLLEKFTLDWTGERRASTDSPARGSNALFYTGLTIIGRSSRSCRWLLPATLHPRRGGFGAAFQWLHHRPRRSLQIHKHFKVGV